MRQIFPTPRAFQHIPTVQGREVQADPDESAISLFSPMRRILPHIKKTLRSSSRQPLRRMSIQIHVVRSLINPFMQPRPQCNQLCRLILHLLSTQLHAFRTLTIPGTFQSP